MATPETLRESENSLLEWLNLPAWEFKFDLPDWDPEKEEWQKKWT